MDKYFVVGIVVILNLRFGMIINIISKEHNSYCITIGDIPKCTCSNFIIMLLNTLRKKKDMDTLQTPMLYIWISMQGGLQQ